MSSSESQPLLPSQNPSAEKVPFKIGSLLFGRTYGNDSKRMICWQILDLRNGYASITKRGLRKPKFFYIPGDGFYPGMPLFKKSIYLAYPYSREIETEYKLWIADREMVIAKQRLMEACDQTITEPNDKEKLIRRNILIKALRDVNRWRFHRK